MGGSSDVSKIASWLKLLGIPGLLGVLQFFWINLISPIGTFDLTVLLKDEEYVSLPGDVVRETDIRIARGNKQFSSAAFLDVVVVNTGVKAIVGREGHWTMVLEAADSENQLLWLPPFTTKPDNVSQDVKVKEINGSVELSVELLKPEDEIRLKLMVPNASADSSTEKFPLRADPPREVEDLRSVSLERGDSALGSVGSRLQRALIKPLFFLSVVAFLVFSWKETWRKRGWELVSAASGRLLLALVVGAAIVFVFSGPLAALFHFVSPR